MEHLVSLRLKDGTTIDFSRTENGEVQILHDNYCVKLPRASGQLTLDLFALLEPFGEIEEMDEKT